MCQKNVLFAAALEKVAAFLLRLSIFNTCASLKRLRLGIVLHLQLSLVEGL